MKKNYLLIAAAAAMFAACSDVDTFKSAVDDNETELIGFQTYHDKATRAAVNSQADLTDANGGFGVYGFKHLNNRTATNGEISVLHTDAAVAADGVDFVTPIFENVKVWYDATAPTDKFTYLVPKYWDKLKYYTFFAYAPQVAEATNTTTGISFDPATGKFTRNDILALQKVNSTSNVTVGQNNRTQYGAADESNAIDYLIAPYVHSQKAGTTNQSGKSYTGKDLTVGFTFSHILSKLNVTVKAKDEANGHEYAGVSDIIINKLNITNLPNNDEVATYVQNSVESAAGTFTQASYTTTLNIVAGTNPTSSTDLWILDGGSKTGNTLTNPTNYIDQAFHYFVAPNTPVADDPSTTEVNEEQHYTLNIDYTINYVDGTVEPFSRSIDLSTETANFTTMAQNNIYNITVIISLDQIYFTVDSVEGWLPASGTSNDTDVDID